MSCNKLSQRGADSNDNRKISNRGAIVTWTLLFRKAVKQPHSLIDRSGCERTLLYLPALQAR